MVVGQELEGVVDQGQAESIEGSFTVTDVRVNLLGGEQDALVILQRDLALCFVPSAEPCRVKADNVDRQMYVPERPSRECSAVSKGSVPLRSKLATLQRLQAFPECTGAL